MNTFNSPSETQKLLERASWLKPLARTLVSDDARADDLVQQTWLAALKRPWQREGAERAWLSRVVRNLANRAHRTESRTRLREERAARPERVDATPDDVIERADLHRRVVEAVLGLEEPYRSVILLRYFEDLGTAEIADRTATPHATVRTRLRRAIERLRERLDLIHGGERSAWIAAIVPLTGLDAGSTGAASAAGSAGSVAGSASAASAASTAGAGTSALTLGGLIMSQKLTVVGVASVITLAAGFGIGRMTGTDTAEERLASGELVAQGDLDSLRSEVDSLQAELAAAKTARDTESRLNEKLEGELAAVKALIQEREETAVAEAIAKTGNLPVEFGKFAELEAFSDADWETIAAAAASMSDIWLELLEAQKNGEPMTDFQQRLRAENNKLVQLAAQLIGKIPSHSPVNGEFSHPVVLSNLMAAALEHAAVPLSEQQRQSIAQLGNQYESEYASMQDEYDESTLLLQKVIDELDLKRNFMSAAKEGLTAEQREAIFHPEIENLMQRDVLSPFTMAIMLAGQKNVTSADGMQGSIQRHLAKAFEINESHAATVQPIVEGYMRDIAPLFETPNAPQSAIHLDGAITAGRAYLRVLEGLLAMPDLSANARTTILNNPGWIVPHFVNEG